MAFGPTVIGSKLSAWTCQPFCCQRALSLIQSGFPAFRLGILHRVLVALRLGRNSLRNHYHSSLASNHCPQNKKPGVERRVQPPTYGGSTRCSTSFLACARKEPHLGLLQDLLNPTVMPLNDPAVHRTPEPFVTIPENPESSSVCLKIF